MVRTTPQTDPEELPVIKAVLRLGVPLPTLEFARQRADCPRRPKIQPVTVRLYDAPADRHGSYSHTEPYQPPFSMSSFIHTPTRALIPCLR